MVDVDVDVERTMMMKAGVSHSAGMKHSKQTTKHALISDVLILGSTLRHIKNTNNHFNLTRVIHVFPLWATVDP